MHNNTTAPDREDGGGAAAATIVARQVSSGVGLPNNSICQLKKA